MARCVDPAFRQGYIKRMARDVELFRAAMAGVKPLKGQKAVRKDVLPRPKADGPLQPKERPLAALGPTQSTERVTASQKFDRDIDRALAKGKRRIDAKLDLHGLTLAAAERAVSTFITDSADQDRRVVLIVTGKGLRLEGGRVLGGRIRAEFAGWLERPELRARVAGVRPAHPRHGGNGAFYVLLRRRSSASSRSLRATPQR
jgi:DNA-nicking Smr family endonuclease